MSNRTALFRAVLDAELTDIVTSGRFRNPPQTSRKYFALKEEGARKYAQMARDRFDDGPFTLIETSIATLAILWEMRGTG